MWRSLRQHAYDWWFPVLDETSRDRGRGRKNRLTRALQRIHRSLQKTSLWRTYHRLTERIYDWWYPRSQEPYPYYGYYGPARKSRASRAWRNLKRTVRSSVPGRQYTRFSHALYEWWFPASNDPYPYLGHHVSRTNRPARTWRQGKRWLRRSWLGERASRFTIAFLGWWYPPVEGVPVGHAYRHRPPSRPVQALKRWHRWFRNTWVGREFGWLLDESLAAVRYVRASVARTFGWRRVRRFLMAPRTQVAIAVLAVLGAAGYWLGVPHYHRFLEARYSQQAAQFLARGDFTRAYLRARQVLRLNPDNAAATRVTADLAELANSPFSIYWRQRTVLLAPVSSNRLALASTAMRTETFPFETAAKTLDEIEAASRRSSAYQLVAGALALRLNDLEQAEQHYAEAVKLQPEDPICRMSLAVLRLQSSNPRLIKDSRTTLELLQTDRQVGLVALRSLVAESAARRDFKRAEQLSSQLLSNTQAAFSDTVVHLALLQANAGTNFATFLREAEQKAMQHPFYIGELAAWLNQFGFASDSLAWLRSLPRPLANQGLIPLAIADAYVALKDWRHLEAYLQSEHWEGLEHIRLALLAFAARNEPGAQHYDLAWRRALSLAETPASVNLLAQMAAGWGWQTEVEQLLWQAASRFRKQPWPLTSLRNLYIGQKNSRGLRRVFEAMVANDPKDKVAKNNFTMLSLLLGNDLAAAHRDAAELHEAQPENAAFASTYAFSLYLQGKAREGLEVLRALKPEELASPEMAVYYGLLLSADGQRDASKDYLDKSSRAFLLPEELALVERARKAL